MESSAKAGLFLGTRQSARDWQCHRHAPASESEPVCISRDVAHQRFDIDIAIVPAHVSLGRKASKHAVEMLERHRLADMRDHTLPGGYNLIVCAMDTAAHPCPVSFPFTLGEGQLRTIYQGWEMLKYNEDLGTMHHGAQLQFTTMLARKGAGIQ